MRPKFSTATIVARVTVRMLRDSRAATAIEYGLILAFVVVALIVGLTALGGATSGMWNTVDTKVSAAH